MVRTAFILLLSLQPLWRDKNKAEFLLLGRNGFRNELDSVYQAIWAIDISFRFLSGLQNIEGVFSFTKSEVMIKNILIIFINNLSYKIQI